MWSACVDARPVVVFSPASAQPCCFVEFRNSVPCAICTCFQYISFLPHSQRVYITVYNEGLRRDTRQVVPL